MVTGLFSMHESGKRRHLMYKAQGRCYRCGGKRDNLERVLCTRCREYVKIYNQKRKALNKIPVAIFDYLKYDNQDRNNKKNNVNSLMVLCQNHHAEIHKKDKAAKQQYRRRR